MAATLEGQPMSEMELRRPHDVAYVEGEDVIYAARLPAGPIQVLQRSAGIIWQEAQTGARSAIAERVAERTAVEADLIRTEVTAFVAVLVAQGLLETHN